MRKVLLILTMLTACGRPESKTEGSTLPPAVDLSEFHDKAIEVETRLREGFLENGWVVSRDGGFPVGVGDSLIFSGIAMGVTSCETAAIILQALGQQLVRTDGAFERFDPLPHEYVGGREVSYDGETGVLLGWSLASQRCPILRPALQELWTLHRRYVLDHGGHLHAGVDDAILVPGLDYAWDMLGYEFGLHARPGRIRQMQFEAVLLSWAQAVQTSRAACYRVHLGLLHVITAAKLGAGITTPAKEKFCAITKRMDIPLTDWFCRRGDVRSWLSSFEYNRWEYRHQRCGAWESSDARSETPGLDFLVLYNLAKE